jgi:hypothetical protein
MLIQFKNNTAEIKFNNRFYSINAIIATNTKFPQFSTQVSFAILNIGMSLYHLVKLNHKSKFSKKDVFAYVNEVLKYEDNMPNK